MVNATLLKDGQYYVSERIQELSQEHGFNYDLLYSNRLSKCLAKVKELRYSNRHIITFNNNYIIACVKNNELDHLEDTILHEVAHILAGGNHHHDYVWKRKCIEIGGSAERLASNTQFYKDTKKKYIYECPHCHKITKTTVKYRTNRACGQCCNKYNNGKYTDEYKMIFKGIEYPQED